MVDVQVGPTLDPNPGEVIDETDNDVTIRCDVADLPQINNVDPDRNDNPDDMSEGLATRRDLSADIPKL